MLIKTLKLKNFKRFADLEINLDPENTGNLPKLVLLIGANGSGKSSIFDGFQLAKFINKPSNSLTFKKAVTPKYFVKNYIYSEDKFEIIFNGKNIEDYEVKSFNFYGLTAFRYISQITKSQIGGQQVNPYKLFIEEEKDKFDQNIDILFNKLLGSLSDNNKDFAQDFIHKMQTGFVNIFGSSDTSLNFKKYESPIIGISPVRFIFAKGNSFDIDYSCLSAGEKMIFIILFDLYLNVSNLTDTIIYLDELDSHLNTSLQKNLLQEITENWIPEGCQLWTASHSLGFIEYARDYENGVIIDLDNLDFDQPQVLVPSDANNKAIMQLALGDEFLSRIEEDLRQAKSQNLYPVFSEGYNKNYLKAANELLKYNLPLYFIDGGGADNLKQHFNSIKNNKNFTIHIFDCDVDLQKFSKTNNHFILQLDKNSNSFAGKGIENMFDKSLILENNRDTFYRKQITEYSEEQERFQKNLFEEFILNRNNPADFANFKPIFEQISQILEQANP